MSDLNLSSVVTAWSRASSADFIRVDEIDPQVFEVVPTWIPNETNAGADEQVGKSIVSVNVFDEKTLSQHFSYQLIGYLLYMIFGKVSKTGSGAPYTHTFACYNKNSDGRQLPTRTVLQRQGAVIKLFRSIGLKELSIEKNGNGFLKVMFQLHGQGYEASDPASYAIPSVNSGLIYGYNREATHSADDGVTGENLSCAVESWKWTFSVSDLGDGFRDCSDLYSSSNAKSGLIRKERLFGAYDFKWSARVRASSTSGLETILRSGAAVELTTTLTSPSLMTATPYSLTISDTNSELTAVRKDGQKGEFIYFNIDAKVNADPSDGLMKTQAVLVNNVASYTT